MPKAGARFGGTFFVEAYDKQGRLKWKDTAKNIVVKKGIQHILDGTFAGGTQVNPWYTGLMATTDITDTYTSTDISEATECSDANRPAYVDARSSETVSNVAAKSTFNINADGTTIEGAFLISSNDFGSMDGLLLSGAPFTGGGKSLASGEKLVVTYYFVGSNDTSS